MEDTQGNQILYVAQIFDKRQRVIFTSEPNADRRAAAREAFNANPSATIVTTCKWFNGWATGSDTQWFKPADLGGIGDWPIVAA